MRGFDARMARVRGGSGKGRAEGSLAGRRRPRNPRKAWGPLPVAEAPERGGNSLCGCRSVGRSGDAPIRGDSWDWQRRQWPPRSWCVSEVRTAVAPHRCRGAWLPSRPPVGRKWKEGAKGEGKEGPFARGGHSIIRGWMQMPPVQILIFSEL